MQNELMDRGLKVLLKLGPEHLLLKRAAKPNEELECTLTGPEVGIILDLLYSLATAQYRLSLLPKFPVDLTDLFKEDVGELTAIYQKLGGTLSIDPPGGPVDTTEIDSPEFKKAFTEALSQGTDNALISNNGNL
jgi:hypothetical protein